MQSYLEAHKLNKKKKTFMRTISSSIVLGQYSDWYEM